MGSTVAIRGDDPSDFPLSSAGTFPIPLFFPLKCKQKRVYTPANQTKKAPRPERPRRGGDRSPLRFAEEGFHNDSVINNFSQSDQPVITPVASLL